MANKKKSKILVVLLVIFTPIVLVLLLYFGYQVYTSNAHKNNLYSLFDPEKQNLYNVKCNEGTLTTRRRNVVCYFSTHKGLGYIVEKYNLYKVTQEIVMDNFSIEGKVRSSCSLDRFSSESSVIYGTDQRMKIPNKGMNDMYGGFSVIFNTSTNEGCVVLSIPYG